jgi:uncharacterized Zn-binding protein involved in type VI secretion
MPAVARKSGFDSVQSPDGNPAPPCGPPTDPPSCLAPSVQATDAGSSTVTINGIGVVRRGDAMLSHPFGCFCSAHAPALSTASAHVTVEGRGLARVGDAYDGHIISSGSANFSDGSPSS